MVRLPARSFNRTVIGLLQVDPTTTSVEYPPTISNWVASPWIKLKVFDDTDPSPLAQKVSLWLIKSSPEKYRDAKVADPFVVLTAVVDPSTKAEAVLWVSP